MSQVDLPLLSKCLLTVFNVICASFYTLLPQLSTYISTGMIGALFVLMFPPIMVMVGCTKLLDFLFPILNGCAIYYIGVPLFVAYVIQVLILDTAHLKPLTVNVHRVPITSNIMKVAHAFWLAHFDYFPTTIVASDKVKLPPEKQYIFAVHPHGIICWPLNSLTFPNSPFDIKFPGLVGQKLCGLAATVMFKIPLVRELFLRMGYVDARKSVAERVLSAGLSLFICTGGEEEVLHTKPGCDTVVLMKRKGFIKLALSYGCTIVPVYGLGVSDLYTTYDLGTLKLRQWLQKTIGVALPIFHGYLGTPLPYKVPLKIVVGEGIETPAVAVKGAAVDEALVEEYHAKYIVALKKLYCENAAEGRFLVVI